MKRTTTRRFFGYWFAALGCTHAGLVQRAQMLPDAPQFSLLQPILDDLLDELSALASRSSSSSTISM